MEIVETAMGPHPKLNCRLIDGVYYLIGNINIENSGEVYLINNRFVRFITGKIVFNHTIKQYQLRNSSLIEGIINFEGDKPVKGYFSIGNSKNTIITLLTGERMYVMDEGLIPLSYREILSKGEFAHISKIRAREFLKLKAIDPKYKESLSYDSRGITDRYTKIFEDNYKPNIISDVKAYAKSIGKLSFGLEFETTKGMIPEHKLQSLPLIPLRDGSIAGLEYVTIPLSGEIGLQAIIDSVKELSKRTEYDDSCALHLHIGNIPRTPEFITAFYKLTAHYQDEMFSMFPLYKKYNFGVKRKNYSKPFPVNLISPQIPPIIDIKSRESVDSGFTPIFNYLAESATYLDYGNNLINVGAHPRDPGGHSKWNIGTRYYAVNFIPLIFGNHQTIEFRIHTPTYDTAKILDFLFMCSYLVNYTIKYTGQILANPTIFNALPLSDLIMNHINKDIAIDSNNKRVLMAEMDNYIQSRIGHTYHQNCRGNVKGNELEIKYKTCLNLSDTDSDFSENKKLPRSEFDTGNSLSNSLQRRISTLRSNPSGKAPFPSSFTSSSSSSSSNFAIGSSYGSDIGIRVSKPKPIVNEDDLQKYSDAAMSVAKTTAMQRFSTLYTESFTEKENDNRKTRRDTVKENKKNYFGKLVIDGFVEQQEKINLEIPKGIYAHINSTLEVSSESNDTAGFIPNTFDAIPSYKYSTPYSQLIGTIEEMTERGTKLSEENLVAEEKYMSDWK